MAVERRFKSTVPFYVRYRTRYPDELLREVAEAAGLDEKSRVLDLGCGPGFLAIGFAPLAGEVLGIDPEPLMLEAARALALAAGACVSFIEGSSETLGPALGRFRLVAMGRSFHWMDRPRTLESLDVLIEPEGAIALFHDQRPEAPENAWVEAWERVRDAWSDKAGSRHRWRSGGDKADHETVLRRSAFSHVRRLTRRWARRTSLDEMIGRTLSMSGTSPERVGLRRPKLEAELRRTLGPFTANGVLTELIEAEALLATRPRPN
jgi:SAM-dependent methyltransferase